MSRPPVSGTFDAVIELMASPDGSSSRAVVAVSKSFRFTLSGLELAAPIALNPEADGSLAPRTRTDVIARGFAFAPGGRPVTESQVTIRVGQREKRVAVLGPRVLEWNRDGSARIPEPQPFTEVSMTWDRAFGGADLRVPAAPHEEHRLAFDHPGVYPRNPFGTGYLVFDAPGELIPLPQLENPDHRLNEFELVVGDPRAWWRMPLPWCLEATVPPMWPRGVWVGANAWYPPPPGASLPEEATGVLPPNWRMLSGHFRGMPPVRFFQQGSHGLVLESVSTGTPVVVDGMHPQLRRLEFQTPFEPDVVITTDGQSQERAAPVLASLLVEPAEERVVCTWLATVEHLPLGHDRRWLGAWIDGAGPVRPIEAEIAPAEVPAPSLAPHAAALEHVGFDEPVGGTAQLPLPGGEPNRVSGTAVLDLAGLDAPEGTAPGAGQAGAFDVPEGFEVGFDAEPTGKLSVQELHATFGDVTSSVALPPPNARVDDPDARDTVPPEPSAAAATSTSQARGEVDPALLEGLLGELPIEELSGLVDVAEAFDEPTENVGVDPALDRAFRPIGEHVDDHATQAVGGSEGSDS